MKASVLFSFILWPIPGGLRPPGSLRYGDNAQAKSDDPGLQDGVAMEDKAAPIISEGFASWYGKELQGRPTASGEMFDPENDGCAPRFPDEFAGAHQKH